MGLDWDEIATEYSTLDALPDDDYDDDPFVSDSYLRYNNPT